MFFGIFHNLSLYKKALATFGLLLVNTYVFSETVKEYQVKAAYLVNFSKTVYWPETAFEKPDSPLYYCMLGGGVISETVKDTINHKMVNGRTVVVLTASSVLAQCHIIFIGEDKKELAGLVFSATEGKDILTVGDFEEFAHSGGLITFFKKNNRINIAIDLAAIMDTKLKLSAKLIKIATINF